jgi:long-chain acyl-CoA synthetase
MNLAHNLRQVARTEQKRPAVALGTRELLNYGQLANRVARFAESLKRRFDLRPNDRAALIMRNCPEYFEVLYGCWHAGLVTVPINPKLHAKEFAYILDHCGAWVCFVSADLASSVPPANGNKLEHLISIGTEDYEQLFEADACPPVERRPDDLAWIFYTSGTTGRPKGASLTCRNILAMSLCYFVDVDPEPPWNCILHASPMSHGSGLYAVPHVMKSSCHIILESGSFSPAEVFELSRRWKGLCFFAAPTMVKRLVDYPRKLTRVISKPLFMEADRCMSMTLVPHWLASVQN